MSLTAWHNARYAEFVAGDYQSYLRDMARDGTWGDHLTLQARSCSTRLWSSREVLAGGSYVLQSVVSSWST